MRYYKLTIGDGIVVGDTFDSKECSTPLNIEFDIQMFSQNATQVLGSIKLYNVSLEYFLLAKTYIGLPIELKAGFTLTDFTAPGYLGYDPVFNDIIFKGYIANVAGEFSGIQSAITFYFTPFQLKENSNVNSQVKPYTMTLKQGDKIATKAKDTITRTIAKARTTDQSNVADLTITILKSAAALVFGGGGTLVTASTVAEFLMKVGKIAGVGSTEAKPLKLKYFVDHTATLNLYAGNDISTISEPVVLTSREFIKQPELTKLSGNLSCVTRLRADLHVGKRVSLAGITPQLSGDFTSVKTLPGGINTTQLFFTGIYTIISVNHTGEYYNTQPESWSTLLELAPIENVVM